MSVATLRNHVERVLSGPALAQALRTHGLMLEGHSAPKQTETTQRWKISIRPVEGGRATPTRPVLTQHYGPAVAYAQKVAALAGRTETQARDVFDLKLLMDQGAKVEDGRTLRKLIPSAVENAMSVGYDQFAGQVLAYLEPDYHEHYRRRAVWEALQDEVVRCLEALAAS